MLQIYETERLVLKVLDSSSAEMVLDYYSRNKEFLGEWEVIREASFYTMATHEENLQKDAERMGAGSLLRFWIFEKDHLDRVIGTFSFDNIVRGAFHSCFLGYKLDGSYLNKGYITEALQTGIEIAFQEHKLHRIEANIMPKNIRSLRVVEKLGFQNEGRSPKYLKINGVWEDHIHMVLLNDFV